MWYSLQLKFTSPLHLSNARADYGKSEKLLHSDTLIAAIMASWAQSGNSDWITEARQALDSGDFGCSSAFPFVQLDKQRPRYFFPKPFAYKRPVQEEALPKGVAKRFKKMAWVEWEDFLELLHGNPPANPDHLVKEYYSSACTDEERDLLPKLITSTIQSRVLRPRNESEDTKPFYMERLYFHEKGGLFSLFYLKDRAWLSRLEKALQVLSSNGLGTDRAVGNGQFDYALQSFEMPSFKPTEFAVNLSLFCPVSQEQLQPMLKTGAAWDIQLRGGWLGEPNNSLRKRNVYMFKEGSVLATANTGPSSFQVGKVLDLRPDISLVNHPVYRSGAALFLPIQV